MSLIPALRAPCSSLLSSYTSSLLLLRLFAYDVLSTCPPQTHTLNLSSLHSHLFSEVHLLNGVFPEPVSLFFFCQPYLNCQPVTFYSLTLLFFFMVLIITHHHISIYLFICSLYLPLDSRSMKAETLSFPICISRPWNRARHKEAHFTYLLNTCKVAS